MGDAASKGKPRPLTRSLEPLTGESLAGYLLRLSCRLRITPLQLARLTGCASGTSTIISRRLLLDLDLDNFARATRLTTDEAAALTLVPWADRYPPIARSRSGTSWPTSFDDWLFNNSLRYCPGCLAGDGSPIQQRYGGPWKKIWHLPIAFACPEHHLFLHEGCPQPHPPDPGAWRLIAHTSGSSLHPAQCRRPEHPGKTGRHRPSCGTRLDLPASQQRLRPDANTLATQQRLLNLFDPGCPAKDAVQSFTDIRVATALLCKSWPLGQNLIDPAKVTAVTEHIHHLGAGTRQALDTPPGNPVAAAALLTAATAILETADLPAVLAQHLQASWPGRPSRAPWVRVLTRHQSTCSPALLQAAEPVIRSYRRHGGSHGPKAPTRTGGYRPEHIPAFLEQSWYQQHLAPLECGSSTSMRRTGAVLLVQWAAGGSMGDAAGFLGINPAGGQHAPSIGLYQWVRDHGSGRFTTALENLARTLDAASGLIDYRHRRQVLQEWSLGLDTWQEIIDHLPPVPGPFQPHLDDRKRQEASAVIWAHTTQGEPRFAPRPIEAGQPENIRQVWLRQRSSTWSKLTRPDPMKHHAALQLLPREHAEFLAREIDNRARDHSE
jgi:hypothetical protein